MCIYVVCGAGLDGTGEALLLLAVAGSVYLGKAQADFMRMVDVLGGQSDLYREDDS